MIGPHHDSTEVERLEISRDVETLCQAVEENRFLTIREQSTQEQIPLTAVYSSRTEHEIYFYNTILMPPLTNRHKADKEIFCIKHGDHAFPLTVIFSDESMVSLDMNKGGSNLLNHIIY
jgi:hypothetical protein